MARNEPVDKLLHVADLHFWRLVGNARLLLNKRFLGNLNVWLRRRHEFPMERAEPFADILGGVGIGQALLTGDLTSTATEEEFALARRFVDGLQRRGMAVALVPGNHDVYTFEARRNRRFERHFQPYIPAEGYPARRDLPGGTPLVLAPTVVPNVLSSKGRVSKREVEHVADLLAGCPSPVIVAGHYPLLIKTYGYASSRGRRLRNAAALRKVLGASGKRVLYVCGHVHRSSYVIDPEFENVRHLTTGALFRADTKRGILGEFTEIHVEADGFRLFHHRYKDDWQRVEMGVGREP